MSYLRHVYLKNVYGTLWMSQRCLLNVMDVSKMFYVCYQCLKGVLFTLCMSKKCLWYVMMTKRDIFVCYGCFLRLGNNNCRL